MDLNVTGAYIYFQIPILGGINITQTAVSLLLVTVLLSVAGISIGRKITVRPGKTQALVERLILMLRGMLVETMGEHNAHWLPYIATIFLSSICGSLIGLTGFFKSSTADLSVTLTWSIMTSVLIWYNNIKNFGFKNWIKTFINPMNIISEVAQPASMALRHFGNVAGGGVITLILYTALSGLSALVLGAISGTIIVPVIMIALGAALFIWGYKGEKKKLLKKIVGIVIAVIGLFGALENLGILVGIPIFQFGLPAVLSVYFDLFSGFVQAFVFSLLNMVYISSACPPPEEIKKVVKN